MVPQIIWSAGAIDTYNGIICYLEDEWTDKEINNFATRVSDKLHTLQMQPRMGRLVNKKHKIYRAGFLRKSGDLLPPRRNQRLRRTSQPMKITGNREKQFVY